MKPKSEEPPLPMEVHFITAPIVGGRKLSGNEHPLGNGIVIHLGDGISKIHITPVAIATKGRLF